MAENITTKNGTAFAVFAGGCFWCLEHAFLELPGVVAVTSGYTGGDIPDPTYEDVCAGITGHAEAVRIEYDPDAVSFKALLDVFWRNIDPTDAGGQFADRGSQYRSVVYYADEEQRSEAEASRDALAAAGMFTAPVATTVEPLAEFYPAEGYHQQYCVKNPIRYRMYAEGSGRNARLAKLWPDSK